MIVPLLVVPSLSRISVLCNEEVQLVAVSLPTNWTTFLTDTHDLVSIVRVSHWIFLNFSWGIDEVIGWVQISKAQKFKPLCYKYFYLFCIVIVVQLLNHVIISCSLVLHDSDHADSNVDCFTLVLKPRRNSHGNWWRISDIQIPARWRLKIVVQKIWDTCWEQHSP